MRWRVVCAKTKGLLFLRLFLFRSFCLKRMKSSYRAEALSNEKALIEFKKNENRVLGVVTPYTYLCQNAYH